MSVQYVAPDQATRSVKEAIIKGVRCKCPNCGEGDLFHKWLKVSPSCTKCGEELHHERAQDFPPYITISIVGHIVVTLVLMVEANFILSMNTHFMMWIPLATVLTLALMQPVKGGVVGMQWALRMFGFDGKSTDE